MAKRKKPKAPSRDWQEPTPEQMLKAPFDRAGVAYRRVPVIVTLASNGTLSQRQFDGLSRYRDVAIASERSPLRSGLDFSPRGGNEGPALRALHVSRELAWLEGELRGLLHIARAVAVDDVTIPQWVVSKIGTIGLSDDEITRVHAAARKIATVEIRMAGEWLAAAIGA
jgi:hypothetical protein